MQCILAAGQICRYGAFARQQGMSCVMVVEQATHAMDDDWWATVHAIGDACWATVLLLGGISGCAQVHAIDPGCWTAMQIWGVC